jgi:hypothetical protein
MLLAFRKSVDFWNASRLHPFVLVIGATCDDDEYGELVE